MLSALLGNDLVQSIDERLALIRLQPACIVVPEPGNAELVTALTARYPGARCEKSVATAEADLLVANLVLPWCREIPATLAAWRHMLRPDGVLMLTVLGPDTLQECQPLPLQPLLLDMHDLGDALVQAGFQGPVLDVEHLILLYRDEKKLQHEMQSAMMLPAGTKTLQVKSVDDGRFPLTLEVIFAHAFRPVNQDVNSEVRVPVARIIRNRGLVS